MALSMEELRLKKQQEVDKSLVAAVEFELRGAIAHAGGDLTGLSVKFSDVDTLMTLRAVVTANKCIAFVGAPTLSDCFRKAVTDAYHDRLKWRKDKWQHA